MKLLLTSKGITNNSIQRALEDMMGKPISEAYVAFIPTAAYGVFGDKSWFVDELQKAHALGWKRFDIVEISALTPEQIKQRVNKSDVIFVNGGNTYFLLNRMKHSGFADILPGLLETKVYVGSSAGGTVVSKHFSSRLARLYGELDKLDADTDVEGLGYTNVLTKPHLNSPEFPERTQAWFDELASKAKAPLYAIDDDTAVKVVDGNTEVISEGTWKLYNK